MKYIKFKYFNNSKRLSNKYIIEYLLLWIDIIRQNEQNVFLFQYFYCILFQYLTVQMQNVSWKLKKKLFLTSKLF